MLVLNARLHVLADIVKISKMRSRFALYGNNNMFRHMQSQQFGTFVMIGSKG